MKSSRLLSLIAMLPLFASACPVSMPNLATPAGALPASKSHGWYGTDQLAALIPRDGHWSGMGPARNYGDKFWWWAAGYSPSDDPVPNLVVSATQLDHQDSYSHSSKATHGYGDDWGAMLVGMEFPRAGCWQVTGSYRGRELRMVLEVGKK